MSAYILLLKLSYFATLVLKGPVGVRIFLPIILSLPTYVEFELGCENVSHDYTGCGTIVNWPS